METILIATDFSPAADNAAFYGLEIAKYFSSKIILLNAYPMPQAGHRTGIPTDLLSTLQQTSLDGLNELKNRLIAKSYPEMEIECISVMGGAYDIIKNAAEQKKVDLVVMGIVGEAGTLKERLIGSTAVKASRHLEVPVLIVPEKAVYHRIRKIAFACDMDKTEETGLVYLAKFFATAFDAELEVVNIEEPNAERSVSKANTLGFIEKKLEAVNHKTFVITDEDVVQGLEDYFKHQPCDIIMLNPKKHNIFQTVFGTSVTRNLAFHAKVPMLMIH